jgi:hypothetical protein
MQAKKNSNIKIHKMVYQDNKERQTGIITDLVSQPDKVLFFAETHFLFNRRQTLHTLASRTSRPINHNFPKNVFLISLKWNNIDKFEKKV